jgi:hypothetical protein
MKDKATGELLKYIYLFLFDFIFLQLKKSKHLKHINLKIKYNHVYMK